MQALNDGDMCAAIRLLSLVKINANDPKQKGLLNQEKCKNCKCAVRYGMKNGRFMCRCRFDEIFKHVLGDRPKLTILRKEFSKRWGI